jgi:hypothetical protein
MIAISVILKKERWKVAEVGAVGFVAVPVWTIKAALT